MKDRIPTYPGRMTLTPVQGTTNTYDVALADEPVQIGTPLNTATMLQDTTAGMIGLSSDATVDDAFKTIIQNATSTDGNVSDLSDALDALAAKITYGTADMVAGTTELATGHIYLQYE